VRSLEATDTRWACPLHLDSVRHEVHFIYLPLCVLLIIQSSEYHVYDALRW
jgi:hypothetical protein